MEQKANVIDTKDKDEAVKRVTGNNNVGGASSAVLRTATASAMVSSSSSTTDVATTANLAQFQQALISCSSQFKSLGLWITNQVQEQMENLIDTLNIPKMLDEFKKLSPVMKVLVVLCVLSILYILQWLTWEAFSFVWPYVLKFVESDTGKAIIQKSTEFLESFGKSEVMKTFDSAFVSAADAATATETEKSSDAEADIPCLDKSIWDPINGNPAIGVIDMMKAFFTWFTTKMTQNNT